MMFHRTRKNWNLVKNNLRAFGLFPLVPFLASVAGVLAGLLGAIYARGSGGLEKSPPFTWLPVNEHVVWFWALVIIFALLFGLATWAPASAASKEIGELRKIQENLERVVRTMPPDGFLNRFETYCNKSFLVAAQASGRNAKEADIISAVRAVLASVLYLAREFDDGGPGTVYSANVMVYHDAETLRRNNPGKLNELQKGLVFFEQGAGAESLAGLLELVPEFSMRLVANGGAERDADTPAIVLPVPAQRNDGHKVTFLPGAPEAFCSEIGYAGYEDTSTLADWCRTNSALRPKVADDIEAYFSPSGGGAAIKSFTSLAFGKPSVGEEEADSQPVGILNLHSNRTEFLGEARRGRDLFVPLIAPLRLLLWGSLRKYKTLVAKQAAPFNTQNGRRSKR
ncbi:MAG: hypothetical protein M0Z85_04845 [Gammaproteobacteria bacterium]|nr:hypothetical protein [Gammaproteobacteria bacterium]